MIAHNYRLYSSIFSSKLLCLCFYPGTTKSISKSSLLINSGLLQFWFQSRHFHNPRYNIVSYASLNSRSSQNCLSFQSITLNFGLNSWPSDCFLCTLPLSLYLGLNSGSMKGSLSNSLRSFDFSLNSGSSESSLDSYFCLSSRPLEFNSSFDSGPSEPLVCCLIRKHRPS